MEEMIELVLPDVAKGIVDALKNMALPDSDEISKWALENERKVYLDKVGELGLFRIRCSPAG